MIRERRADVTIKVKKAVAIGVGGYFPAEVMNDTFIIDEIFCISRNDIKIMREWVKDLTGISVPFKQFENSSIENIVDYILSKVK